MSLLFPTLAVAGLLAAAAPILIHLLSRLRRREVRWGAMEFLLASHQKSRLLVRLNEALLLAGRVAIVVVGGVLVAGPLWSDASVSRLLRPDVARLIIVDDSLSMTENLTGQTPWQEAMKVAQAVARGAQLAETAPPVVIRYRDALGVGADSAEAAPAVDLPVIDLAAVIEEGPSPFAIGPEKALELAGRIVEGNSAGTIVYWLSDFRRWPDDQEIEELARGLASRAGELVLCPCGVPVAQPNLVVESLHFDPGAYAAGTEAVLHAKLVNAGLSPSPETMLSCTIGETALPAQAIESLAPGQSVDKQFVIRLQKGANDFVVSLPEDAIAVDGISHATILAPPRRKVRLVDGSRQGAEGQAFAAALMPSGFRTGWQVESYSTTRLTPGAVTAGDDAVVLGLLDVAEVSPRSVLALEQRAELGGGILISLGQQAEPTTWRRLFGADKLVPVDIGPASTVSVRDVGLRVTKEGPLARLADVGASLLPLTRVSVRRQIDPTQDAWRVAASTSAGDPLLVVGEVGKARIALLATSVAASESSGDRWSNLATLPLFPLFAGDLFNWLAEPELRPVSVMVGQAPPDAVSVKSVAGSGDQQVTEAADFAEPGIYELLLSDGRAQRVAAVIDPREGRLARLPMEELAATYGQFAAIEPAEHFGEEEVSETDFTPVTAAALLALLGAERLMSLRGV